MNEAAVVFSKEELWYLRSVVRHEMAGGDAWRFPPVSLDLNSQIADAILLCEDQGQDEAALTLTMGDCYLIDAVVDQNAKDANGRPIGKPVLLKAFRARTVIAGYPQATAEEPKKPTAYWLVGEAKKKEEGNAKSWHHTGHDPDD